MSKILITKNNPFAKYLRLYVTWLTWLSKLIWTFLGFLQVIRRRKCYFFSDCYVVSISNITKSNNSEGWFQHIAGHLGCAIGFKCPQCHVLAPRLSVMAAHLPNCLQVRWR